MPPAAPAVRRRELPSPHDRRVCARTAANLVARPWSRRARARAAGVGPLAPRRRRACRRHSLDEAGRAAHVSVPKPNRAVATVAALGLGSAQLCQALPPAARGPFRRWRTGASPGVGGAPMRGCVGGNPPRSRPSPTARRRRLAFTTAIDCHPGAPDRRSAYGPSRQRTAWPTAFCSPDRPEGEQRAARRPVGPHRAGPGRSRRSAVEGSGHPEDETGPRTRSAGPAAEFQHDLTIQH